MVRVIFFIFFAFVYINVVAQEKKIIIRLLQDESLMLSDFQDVIRIKKKPFKFQISLKNMDGLYVFASMRDSVYRFNEKDTIRDFKYLRLLQLEEDKFNVNKFMNLSETGWSYWFYNSAAEWHPFSKKIIKMDSSTVICTKSIKQVKDLAEQRVIRIKDITSPIYLFFVGVAEYDADGNPKKELLRRKLKIEWITNEE